MKGNVADKTYMLILERWRKKRERKKKIGKQKVKGMRRGGGQTKFKSQKPYFLRSASPSRPGRYGRSGWWAEEPASGGRGPPEWPSCSAGLYMWAWRSSGTRSRVARVPLSPLPAQGNESRRKKGKIIRISNRKEEYMNIRTVSYSHKQTNKYPHTHTSTHKHTRTYI